MVNVTYFFQELTYPIHKKKKKSNMDRNNPLSVQRNKATIKKKIIKTQELGVKETFTGHLLCTKHLSLTRGKELQRN